MPPLFDSHAHLHHRQFDRDRDQALERARAAGVRRILNLGTRLDDSRAVVELANRHSECLAAVGVHPCDIEDWSEETERGLRELARDPRVVVWGEIGLDYYHPGYDKAAQRRVFRRQLAIARELRLPVSMHCRGEAYDDLIADLRAERAGEIGGVSHCFAGSERQAREIIDMELALGVGGIVTFPKAEELRGVLRAIGIEHLILETDSPYLAPQPHRGKRNEPAYVAHTAEALAAALAMEPDALKETCWRNTLRVFRLDDV